MSKLNNGVVGNEIVRQIVESGDERRAEKTDIAQNNKPPIMDQSGQTRDMEYQDLVKEVTLTFHKIHGLLL